MCLPWFPPAIVPGSVAVSSKRVTLLTYSGGVKGRCADATPARLVVASPAHARPTVGEVTR